MKELSLEDIRKQALDYQNSGLKWHFHILTPECSLNDTDKFVFVLESPSKKETYAFYGTEMPSALGKELAPLIHSVEVEKVPSKADTKLSVEAQKIIDQATEMNKQKIAWHHHVLYPGCLFNVNSPKFTLMLEDKITQKTYESISNNEPKEVLRQLEPLFYSQK